MSKKSDAQAKSKKKLKVEDIKIPDCWLNELASLEINAENWYCHVSIVVESDPDTTVFIEHFNEACQDGLRKEIQVISKYEILRAVTLNLFSKENAKKSKTPFVVLCDEIYKRLGPNIDGIIPTDMIAALIKYLILQYKDFNIRRRMEILISNEAVEEALHKEICDKLQTFGIASTEPPKTTKASNKSKATTTENPKNTGQKSPDKKMTKTKRGEEITKAKDPNIKATSKLRRRGEEWKDTKWIDDAPEGGPQLYVVISTLHLADLPQELLKLHVPLNSIIKINVLPNDKDYNFYSISNVGNLQMQEELLVELKLFKQQSAPYLKTAVKQHFTDEELNLIESKLNIEKFWKQLQQIIYNKENILQFKDVMFVQFTPNITNLDFEQTSFQGSIYDQISFLLYQLFDFTEYHKHYLNQMKVLDMYDSVVCSLDDKRLYKTILDSVPPEFINIPFVLHAILCQVEKMCTGPVTEELTDTTMQDTNSKLSENINIIKLKLLLNDLNKQNDLFYTENKIDLLNQLSSEATALKILSNSNRTEIKTFHFKDIGQYIEDITFHMLLTTWKYILSSQCNTDIIDSLSVSYKEVLSECEKYGHDNSNLIYYFFLVLLDREINSNTFSAKKSFIQIVDEFMHSPSNESSGSLQSKDSSESLFKQNNCFHYTDCSIYSEKSDDNSSNKTENSIEFYSNREDLSAIRKKSFLKKYKYFEELCPSDMLQVIQEAYFESNTMQHKFFPCTDQKLLLIYNTLNFKTKFYEHYEMTKLRSEVGLRDFVEFILNEETACIQKLQTPSETNIPYNMKTFRRMKSHLISVESKHYDLSRCEDNSFISRNTLKRAEQPVVHIAVEIKSPKQAKKAKSTTQEKKRKSVEIKKKEKGSKLIKDDIEELKTDTQAPPKSYNFLGYELGPPVRVQFSRFTREIFLSHQCKLTVNTLKRLYKSEHVSLCVAKCGYRLYFHNDEKNKNGSFHIYHESGAIIHFCKKETDVNKELTLPDVDHNTSITDQVSNHDTNTTDQVNTGLDEVSRESQVKQSNCYDKMLFITDLDNLVMKDDFDISSGYNVNISLPSGILINIFTEVPGVFYIKQTYLNKGPMCSKIAEENYRCLLKNGIVIKYLNNGLVEILCPNSTIYRCKEFEWTNDTKDIKGKDIKNISNIIDEVKQTARRQSKFESRKSIRSTPKNKKSQHLRTEDTKAINENRTAEETPVSEGQEVPYLVSRKYEPVHYDVTYSDGKQMTFKNNMVTSEDTLFILETNRVNEETRCVERTDYTELQYLNDGSLLVSFSDGTRITTTVSEDEHELFCAWTESEYLLWFSEINADKEVVDKSMKCLSTKVRIGSVESASGRMKNNGKNSIHASLGSSANMKKSTKSSNKMVKSSLESSVSDNTSRNSKMKPTKKPLLKDDGYIVINMTYTIEHPNYATVTYDYKNFCLKLPTDMSVTLSPLGEYMVQLGNDATLTTGANEIIFNRINNNSKILLNTVIYTEPFVETDTLIDALCVSKDEQGNKVIISRDGNIHQNSGLRFSSNTHKDIEGFNCFVLNYNFSGFKFLHKTELLRHNEMVTHCEGLHRKYKNTFNSSFTSIPVLLTESERWVMSYQTNPATREIRLPSTFGEQNSYLHPFKTKTPSLCAQTELPNTVMIRLIHELPPLNKDVINCCLRIFNIADIQNDSAHLKLSLPSHRPKTTDFNVSVIKNDPELLISIYEESRKQCENKVALDLLREKEIYNLLHKVLYTLQKLHEKENNDFMRHSLREHIVPPYFSSPMGQIYDLLFNIINKITWADKNNKEKIDDSLITLCDKMSFSIPEESVKHEGSDDLITLCEKMSFSIPEETTNLKSSEDDIITLCEKISFSIPEETTKHQSSEDDLITLCEKMSFSIPEETTKHQISEDDLITLCEKMSLTISDENHM